MADTVTTTLGLTKPEVGASEDSWGEKINTNFDLVDDALDGTTAVSLDINGGTIDGAVIGGATPAAGTFTTLTANTSIGGTLSTAAQPNVTSVGSLTSLDVTGTVTATEFNIAEFSTSTNVLQSNTGETGARLRASVSSAGFPTFAFSDDDNTGIFRPAADTLGFSTNASEAMRIDSSGNVGIGTSSPSALIHASGAAASGGAIEIRLEDTAASSNSRLMRTGSAYSYAGVGANETWLYHAGAGTINIGPDGAGAVKIVNNGTERMRIDSSGNVGIGTTSPAGYKLHVADGTPTVRISGTAETAGLSQYVTFGTPSYNRSTIQSTNVGTQGADLKFLTAPSGGNATERMRIDSSGNVGIGTSSPAKQLHIESSTGGTLRLSSSDASVGAGESLGQIDWYSNDSSGSGSGVRAFVNVVENDGGLGRAYDMTFGTGQVATATERMRIDSSGNVGIGTSNPYGDLHLQGAQQDVILTNSDADGVAGATIGRFISQARGYGNNGAEMASIDFETNASAWYKGDIVFKTNNSDGTDISIDATERMRIDSSGHLLVGTTNSSILTASSGTGMVYRNGVALDVAREATGAGQPCVNLNMTGTDGAHIIFYKNGTSVGSIGTVSGGVSLGSGDTGLYFEPVSNEIRPFNTTTNASIDNAINLGNSTKRFKDLYLSGGVYLGGVGSSNLLDSYEEGTWVAAINTEGGTAYTVTTQDSRYTKIGNVCHIQCDITFSAEGSGTVTLISLPFTPLSNTEVFNGFVTSGTNRTSIQLTHYSGPNVLVRRDQGTSAINYWTPKTDWSPTNKFVFTGTYLTN